MKKLRNEVPLPHGRPQSDLFESLHDDIVIFILCKLSSSASSPSDFIAVLHTCKRLNKLGLHPFVLSKSCSKALAVRAKNWCEEAHKFLKLCVNAGNTEAYYILGMDAIRFSHPGELIRRSVQRPVLKTKIRFYCLQNRESGASLMAKAAVKSHAPALYSLGLLQFNGSGGLKNDKDLRAGVSLCARAACLGHPDALRELAHCLQDGYGVRRNIAEGHRLLVQANAREFASVLRVLKNEPTHINFDYGFSQATRQMHPVNKFMVEWFGSKKNGVPGQGLRMCSYKGCGRPETRINEFRRCSGCGKVNYCSRGCQAHDWRLHHKVQCAPIEEWMGHAINDVEEEVNMNGEDYVMDDRTVDIEEGGVDAIEI